MVKQTEIEWKSTHIIDIFVLLTAFFPMACNTGELYLWIIDIGILCRGDFEAP